MVGALRPSPTVPRGPPTPGLRGGRCGAVSVPVLGPGGPQSPSQAAVFLLEFLWPNWQQQDPRGLTGAMGEAPAGPVGVKKAPRSSTDHARHGREDRRIWFRGSGVHSERITPDEHGPLTAVPTQVPGPHLHEGTNPENPRDRRGELSD